MAVGSHGGAMAGETGDSDPSVPFSSMSEGVSPSYRFPGLGWVKFYMCVTRQEVLRMGEERLGRLGS